MAHLNRGLPGYVRVQVLLLPSKKERNDGRKEEKQERMKERRRTEGRKTKKGKDERRDG